MATAWIVGLFLCAFLFWHMPVAPEGFEPSPTAETLSWPEAPAVSTYSFSTLTGSSGAPMISSSASRFRLAGTFLQRSEKPGEEQRLAILDDLELNRQYLMREGDREGALEVVRVEQTRVEIIVQGLRSTLELSFQMALVDKKAAPEPKVEPEIARFESMPALETSPFGKRIATNQWVLKREALLSYYNEMLDDPERLANLYMSFRPEYNEEDKIGGYQLEPRGKDGFLSHMGMLEGDVVRKVNSLEMTSQRRAEYFIGTFARDQLNAVVLDIERDGKSEKLIYMIR